MAVEVHAMIPHHGAAQGDLSACDESRHSRREWCRSLIGDLLRWRAAKEQERKTMPCYEQLVTRKRRIIALGRIQEMPIVLDVIEGGRFQGIAAEFNSAAGEPSVHALIALLDEGEPKTVIFYGQDACEEVKKLRDGELVAIAGEKEKRNHNLLRAFELYAADKDPTKDTLLWAHPEIKESIHSLR
jgi:hypothetical protein